jgi:glycosyltransferase involved in cell wall biosynthesis
MKKIQSICLFIGFYICFFLVKIATYILPAKKYTTHKTVLYLELFFPENAGYIYRTKKWAEILTENGYKVDIKIPLTKKQSYKYFEAEDVRFYLIPLFKRTWQVLTSYKYNVVIARRELLQYNDYGNLFLEKLLLKIHPKAILDFDDDISAAKQEPREITNFFGKLMLESGTKFTDSLKLYNKFIVGSSYLKHRILSIKENVNENEICIIPTCVDYESYSPKDYKQINKGTPINLGWIGSNENLGLLERIIPYLEDVNKKTPIKLIIISGREVKPKVDFEIENILWSYETQIENLLKIDIGLMPLENTPVTRGKCGFKLIQYMGLGIVSVAGAVTINKEIVDDRINGFLIEPEDGWTDILLEVFESKENFSEMSKLARKKIMENYSFQANTQRYLDFVSYVKSS